MFSEELKTLRSNFLVHWTGRDLEQKYPFHSEAKHSEYVQRLIGTLKEGLWINKIDIELYDKKLDQQIKWPSTCFTEIKLTQIKKHTDRYGRLGFGFSRDFVMQHYGAPVLYISSNTVDNIVYQHLSKLYDILQYLNDKRYIMQGEEFEKFMQEHGYITNPDNDLKKTFESLENSITTISIFTKKMSESTNPHDFQYLDEFEWRIPFTTTVNPSIKPPIERLVPIKQIYLTNQKPIAKIPFYSNDLKVLIFPDDETRRIASDNEFFQCWLKERNGFPIMATVDECAQF